MAKIKHTKNELKAQRLALRRFERFLPMLQLKKQQLQSEIQAIDAAIRAVDQEEEELVASAARWLDLFSDPNELDRLITFEGVETEDGNIAGVAIPIFKAVHLKTERIDFFQTPFWYDDALALVSDLIRLRKQREILQVQRERIAEELRTTSQRVNLFEKVKIPESREHIRIIRIFLGDEQTAAVARGKLAKKRVLQNY